MAKASDLNEGVSGAAPLWMLASGELSASGTGEAPRGFAALKVLVTGARWFARRTRTLSAIIEGRAVGATEGAALFAQLESALDSKEGKRDTKAGAQLRSAALTIVAELLANAAAPGWRALADRAAGRIFAFVEAEPNPRLRAHAIILLQVQGNSLNPADRARAQKLAQGLVRAAPPYAELTGPWRFAMASDPEFHEGEVKVLQKTHGFVKQRLPPSAPKSPRGSTYVVLRAPFKAPGGQPIDIYARSSQLGDEDYEMGQEYFLGLLINRHAQLGSFDLVANATRVEQHGYKLMMNSQCAGLTTRFVLHERFPDANLYSSWDSTQFETAKKGGEVTASEGQDCFVAILQGMAKKETHAQLEKRIRKAQWDHAECAYPGFVQFVGPAHELVVARFEDVGDGSAAYSDAFLDFDTRAIAEEVRLSATPRDPKVAASQVGGDAAAGLDWAAGSLDRVTRYSEIWVALPGKAEYQYAFESGGFYSQKEPPGDVPVGAVKQNLALLPSVCRYENGKAGLSADVMLHSYLSHSGKEYKRMLCAAEAYWRAIDLGYLPKTGPIATPLQQRLALLLMLAGLLDFPAETAELGTLWNLALQQLNLPAIPRSLVDSCITEKDHDEDHYYGSLRGMAALDAAIKKADPAAYTRLSSADPLVGRARELSL